MWYLPISDWAPYILPIFENISLVVPTKISEFPSISNTSPYLEFQVSLPKFENFLLCLIILPIWKRKSPYLSFQMYHMYEKAMLPVSYLKFPVTNLAARFLILPEELHLGVPNLTAILQDQCNSLSCPPPWVSSPPEGKVPQSGYLAPHPEHFKY